jgi:hypothetical protein
LLYKQTTDNYLKLDDDLRRYIYVYFEEVTTDWSAAKDKRKRRRKLDVKVCTAEDFGSDTDTAKLFSSWGGAPLLCPDLRLKPELYGTFGSEFTKDFRFVVEKCNNSTYLVAGDEKCRSHDEIQSFISDVEVEAWDVRKIMEFDSYENPPYFEIQEMKTSELLGQDLLTKNYFMLAEHTVATEDYFLNLGLV